MKRRRGAGVLRQERVPDFGADFEGARSDRRAEPGDEFARLAVERRNRRLDDAGGEPAPARVRDADAIARAARQEDRQAVGDQHRADLRRA